MHVFQAIKDSDLHCRIFGNIHLERGKSYYAYSKLARDLSEWNIAVPFNGHRPIPHFDKDIIHKSGKGKRVLLIHSGGYGDTITTGILLPLLEKRFNVSFDVSCHYDKWSYILRPMGFNGNWIPYPISLDSIEGYDFILTQITHYVTDPTRLLLESPLNVVAESFDIQVSDIQIDYSIPEEVKRARQLPQSKGIRIGINFDSMGAIKSYPADLQPSLVHSLKNLGFEIFFLGTKPLSPFIDPRDNLLHDLTNRTSIPELAAALKQMDFVIGVDSFVSHLAALLKRPILVLLSATNKNYFDIYKTVWTMASGKRCAPCLNTGDICPQGYGRCHAFLHETILPDKIVTTIIKKTARLYKIHNAYNAV